MTILCSMDKDPTKLYERYLVGSGAIKVPLEYGDFAWFGKGWGDEPISVCVERKRVRDLINSLVLGKRLVQQVADAHTIHKVLYLVVEGVYRAGDDGLLETLSGGEWKPLNCGNEERPFYIGYTRLSNSLTGLETVGGVRIRWTSGPAQTAQTLRDLYHWWQLPPEEHTTTQSFYNGPLPLSGRLSLVRRMAKELPGVGWELSGRVDQRFGTVREMVNASIAAWEDVEGIGKKKAVTIDLALGER